MTRIDIDLPNRLVSPYYGDFETTRLTMQAGPYQAGGKTIHSDRLGTFKVPSFQTPSDLQHGHGSLNDAWIAPSSQFPVYDLNAHGQAVGVGVVRFGPASGDWYAAFSAPGLVGHGGYSPTVDNLNNYVAPLPDITLDVAGLIDDEGRIIADGSDGQGDRRSYLLTPVGLGEPATVPEPTTLATLGAVGGVLCIRARSRRRRTDLANPLN